MRPLSYLANLGFVASTCSVLALTRLFLNVSGGSGRCEDEDGRAAAEEEVAAEADMDALALFMEGSGKRSGT